MRYDALDPLSGRSFAALDPIKYKFSGPERLIADFQADIERWDHENGNA